MNLTKKLAVIVVALGSVSVAQAGLISIENTDTEFSSGRFTDLQGSEWLTLDQTIGLSRYTVTGTLDTLEGGGWRYATRTETETLLGSIWGGNASGWFWNNYDGARWFGEIFGYTGYDGTHSDSTFTNLGISEFLFGDTYDCSDLASDTCIGTVRSADNIDSYVPAWINGEFTISAYRANSGEAGFFEDEAGLDGGYTPLNDTVPISRSEYKTASLLVRGGPSNPPPPPPPPPQPVSEPSTLALFGLGLLGMGLARRRKERA